LETRIDKADEVIKKTASENQACQRLVATPEGYLCKAHRAEVWLAEIRAADVHPAKICLAEVSPAEVSPAEVRVSEACFTEVRLLHSRTLHQSESLVFFGLAHDCVEDWVQNLMVLEGSEGH